MAKEFQGLKFALLTVSDTRNEGTDKSGAYLAEQLRQAGHILQAKLICKDNIYQIRSLVSQWIADETHVVLITGGTGLFESDVTPEAIRVLFDKEVPGFGELFRSQSHAEIGSSTIQSRVLMGMANRTLICALPGSTHACKTGWQILAEQLDGSRHCSFVNVLTQETKYV